MIDYKNSVTAFLPVRFLDVTGRPVAGIAFGSVTATVVHADLTTTDITPASGSDFVELTGVSFGPFTDAGCYMLKAPGASVAVNGALLYAVATSVPNVPTHIGAVDTVQYFESDTYAQVALVKAKTDNLPTDPADESLLEAAITAATSPLATAAAVALVKAKTDNLPSDPADESLLEAAITAATSPLATAAAVALVKAKTDNLPSDPADQSLIIAAIDALDFDVSVDLTPVMLSIAGVSTKIGTPTNGTIAQDIADIDCSSGGGVVSQGRRI